MGQFEASAVLKRELRKKMRSLVQGIPRDRIAEESARLSERLLSSNCYRASTTIALFSSMPHEFDTSEIMRDALLRNKRVFLPRVLSTEKHMMAMLEVRTCAELESWTPNSWGICEPPLEIDRADSPRDTALDLIVMPGVAFDMSGARCGYGMGFYDAYLSRYKSCRGTMPHLVAPALCAQVIESIPMTETDWRVDQVIVVE